MKQVIRTIPGFGVTKQKSATENKSPADESAVDAKRKRKTP